MRRPLQALAERGLPTAGKQALRRVTCGALALLATGCALTDKGREDEVSRPSQSAIVEQWTAALRDLGKLPVHPPTEDVYVGDVFAFPAQPDGTGTLVTLRSTANPRWNSLQVLANLDGEYRERPDWNRTDEAGPDEPLYQDDRAPLRHRIVDLDATATATLETSDLAPFLPVEVAPLLLGSSAPESFAVSIKTGEAESYSLSVDALLAQLLEPPAADTGTGSTLKPEHLLTLPLATETTSGKAYLGVVSEVLYLRNLDAILRRRGARARTSSADETAAALRRAAEMNAALERSDIEERIVDSIEFVSVTDDVLSLRRSWRNPPAVAVRGMMLEVDASTGEVLRSGPLGLTLPGFEREKKRKREADESTVLEERRRGAVTEEEEARTGIYWDVGPRYTSKSGELDLFLGGRLHLDVAAFEEDDEINAAFGEPDSGFDFRRVFLELAGVYKRFDFNFWVNFSEALNERDIEEIDFRNVFVGMHGIPYVGNARVGFFKEPFGLEEITSSNDITFMERSLTDAFIERRNLGIMLERRFAKERRGTAALGVYKDANTELDTGTGVGVTGRITGAPILSDDERRVLHLGTSATYRDPGSDGVRFFQRPESSQAQVLADTGRLDADSDFRLGLEVAGTLGSLSLQSEAIVATLDGGQGVGDPTFWSAYVMGSYVLTGEHRSYRERVGAYGSVHPDSPFAGGGSGAFELATRYSYLDLDSADVQGGRLHDWTLGVNWYANLNMRMMFNYILAHPEGFEYEHIIQARLQLTF